MICGIGVDMVEIERIKGALSRFGNRFAGKVLSTAEMQVFESRDDPAVWLAKRFAAKEAVAKALGTGMRAGVHFSQIEINRSRGGAPTVVLSGAAEARARRLGVTSSHVSISDERAWAVAFAVLEQSGSG